jgi:hypothetical protein
VKGAFDVSSTKDLGNSCDPFKKLAPTKQGGNGHFQGTFSCTSNNQQANEGGSGGTSTGGGSSNGTGNAAAYLDFSMPVVLGVAVLGGLAQAM